jgi:NADH-quinone oxidoreductase subunit L
VDDPQDMRNMGGLGLYMPTTRWTYLAACFAIAGFPLMSGFFSKDEILWMNFANAHTLIPGHVLWAMGAGAALLTAFYMFRSYFMTFSGTFRGNAETAHHLHESPRTITVVLQILGVLSIVGGVMGLPKLWHLPNVLEQWLEPVFENAAPYLRWHEYGHGMEWALMAISVVVALTGASIAYSLYKDARSKVPAQFITKFPALHRLVYNKYYIDELYQATFIAGTLALSRISDWIDKYLIDGLVNFSGTITRQFSKLNGWHDNNVIDGAVNGVADVMGFFGSWMRRIQTGRIQTYLYVLLAGGLFFIIIRFFIFS